MFRLERTTDGECVRLTLEGELKGENVPAAESSCLEALSHAAQVDVLLGNVTEIDAEGRAFLQRLVMTRARVRADGIYAEFILCRMKSRRMTAGDSFRKA